MRKSLYLFVILMMVIGMGLMACGGAATTTNPEPAVSAPVEESVAEPVEETAVTSEKTVLNVWSFTNEINTMAVAYECRNPNVDVKYTMIPMTNGEYQTKLLASLGTNEAPDVIALEASFVKSYVESDFLADLGVLLPEAEAAGTYPLYWKLAAMTASAKPSLTRLPLALCSIAAVSPKNILAPMIR
jgi:multiple sugar transport system substrate-binding protein